jgi:tRNA A37 threonylcarbamoyladenosine dehydratase
VTGVASADADLERRFGGLRRLYGEQAYGRLRAARVAVVGLGGVGSWTVEALARCGVHSLVLIDLDHVAESNINRQVQALDSTLGQAKGQALAERVGQIHPGCHVRWVDDFVTPEHWPALLPEPVDVLVDACDGVRAKLALARWGRAQGVPVVCVGAAGGKRQAQRVEVADLRDVTHDPLLAALRQRLRQAERQAGAVTPASRALGLRCVFSRETVAAPADACADGGQARPEGSLNCAGYGSVVMVTATFGLVAAQEALALCMDLPATPVEQAILEGSTLSGAGAGNDARPGRNRP